MDTSTDYPEAVPVDPGAFCSTAAILWPIQSPLPPLSIVSLLASIFRDKCPALSAICHVTAVVLPPSQHSHHRYVALRPWSHLYRTGALSGSVSPPLALYRSATHHADPTRPRHPARHIGSLKMVLRRRRDDEGKDCASPRPSPGHTLDVACRPQITPPSLVAQIHVASARDLYIAPRCLFATRTRVHRPRTSYWPARTHRAAPHCV
ncbi:hypothetical protein C8R44DRAFT_808219, partial [Mycena epipterygia]